MIASTYTGRGGHVEGLWLGWFASEENEDGGGSGSDSLT